MDASENQVRDRLREIERAFTAFERGDRNRLYETRDSLMGLTGAVEASDDKHLGPLSEIASRMLGLVIMEGGLTEARSVQVVRELLAFIEAQLLSSQDGEQDPGGVFHVVNSEKLGDLLVRKGLISAEEVHKALLLQRVSNGRRFGQVLVAMNAIDQRTLEGVLSDQRDETRRQETRRTATGRTSAAPGQPSIPLAPLPQMPPLPGAASTALPPLPGAPQPQQPPAPLPQPGVDAPGLSLRSEPEPKEGPKLGLNWLDNK